MNTDAAVRRAAGRVAEAVRAALPEARVSVTDDAVVIEGRGLADDPRLRWIGGLLK